MRLPLDQNFPEPILEGLEPWMGDVQLVPLRTIDHRLTTLDDRELLICAQTTRIRRPGDVELQDAAQSQGVGGCPQDEARDFRRGGCRRRSDTCNWSTAP